ncbi:mechanosensitive ion channel domain-containing protein [Phenylobacterium sp.]|uniref:mechanosensitive ion channel family protein n=1 Tax=Phenylobacterium sp. TaxID=1871053 RepID=UPI0025EADE7E|nr:mechanosensitive ion channel domain-containing protein [Phenylobacterium sp.]
MPAPNLDLSIVPTWIPPWSIGLVLIAAALGAAIVLHRWIVRGLTRQMRKRSDFARSLLIRTQAPGRFAMLVGALSWSLKIAPVAPRVEGTLQHVLLVAFIVLVGWALMTALDIVTAVYLRRHRTDVDDNLQARKLLTQTRILRRSLNVLVLVVTVAMALMTVPGVKQIGVSLLAAGGAASIIVGLALQPVLSNIMAGIQIAFTQPIRIDDAVTVGGEFGHVEEIKSTYVVIRLTDLRRMIVPLKYFLEQPFQNWTLEASDLIGEVMLRVDQRVPMDRLRAAIEDIVKASPHWDGRLVKVLVNDIFEKDLQVRCRVSARNAAESTELRAEVREQAIAWLQRELPQALPRSGVEFPAAPTPPAPSRRRAGSAAPRTPAAPRPVRPN